MLLSLNGVLDDRYPASVGVLHFPHSTKLVPSDRHHVRVLVAVVIRAEGSIYAEESGRGAGGERQIEIGSRRTDGHLTDL